MHELLSAWLLTLMICSTGLGAQASESSLADQFPPAPMTPDQVIRHGVDELARFLNSGTHRSAEDIRAFLDDHIAGHFDFDYMAKWAAGSFHRRLNDEQRGELVNHLMDLFLNSLARNMGSFSVPMPEVVVSDAHEGRSRNEVAVLASVNIDPSFTITLEFRFYWSPGGWKIFDVAANGTSAVAYYRRFYTEQLRRYGPAMFDA